MGDQDPQTSVGPRILLIEDDPLLVNMYREKFENEGLSFLTAEDGEEGLKLALEGNVSMIILDLRLPKLSGIELLTQLRNNPKGKNVAVIVLTNMTDTNDAKKALALGAKEYLVKADLTPTQLVTKIKTYL